MRRIMSVAWLTLGLGGCSSTPPAEAPTIRVNQNGLLGRIAQTSGEDEHPQSDTPNETDPGMVATPPSEDRSASRVSFRRATEPEESTGNSDVRSPDLDLSDVRDPRREEFLRREETRGRQ